MGESVVVSPGLVDTIVKGLEEEMEPRAKKDVESGAYAQSLVDSRTASGRDFLVGFFFVKFVFMFNPFRPTGPFLAAKLIF